MSLSDLAARSRTRNASPPVIPPSAGSIVRRRLLAASIDAVLILLPIVVGTLIVVSLAGARDVGSADLVVFGGFFTVVGLGLYSGLIGNGKGARGASPGDRWCGLVVLARDGSRLGFLRALNPFSARDVMTREQAESRGYDAAVAPQSRRRRLGLLLVLAALLVMLVLASLAVGSRALGITEVLAAVLPPYAPSDSDADLIIRELRFPRTLLAIVIGAALGVAGAAIQGHTRNALADPGLLGVSAGAACAVVVGIFTLGISTPLEYVWFAFVGALAASAVVFGVSSIGRGAQSPLTLILAGSVLAAILASVTSAIVLIDETALDSYRFWVVGSLAGRDLDVLVPLLPFFIVGLVLAFAGAPGLNLLTSGDDVARGLGVNVTAHRVLGILAITLLAGAATAACGPIGFVGLVAPHAARALVGNDYRWSMPVSALAGAVLLVAADTLGRILVRPAELQVGIVVALIGGPFFIALIRRRKLAAL